MSKECSPTGYKQMNMEKWTKEALKYAIGNDIFNETEAGGNDLAFDNLKIDTSNAVSVPVTSVTSIIDSIKKGS
jgi:hypothetical protein